MSFKFDKSMLSNGASANITRAGELKNQEFEIKNIELGEIQRSEQNFYDLKDIEELAEQIKIKGLFHNILVRKIEDSKENSKSKYELISGERRYLAHKKLFEDGNKFYGKIACKVVTAANDDAEIMLIEANALARELTEIEKLEQVKRLNTLYNRKKESGDKIPGGIQKKIAELLKMSESAVGRAQKVNNNLTHRLMDKVEDGTLNISSANELASLPESKQKIAVEVIGDKALTKEQAKKLKETLSEVEYNEEEKDTLIDNIKESFVNFKENIVHTKALDLDDKINKVNNMVMKLMNDLDKKEIINSSKSIKLLSELEANMEQLSAKIKGKNI